jgi:hypothetical protein
LPVVVGDAAVTAVFVVREHAGDAMSAQLAIPQRIEVRRFRMSWLEYARRGLFLPSLFLRVSRARPSRALALDAGILEIDPNKT